ALHIFGLSKQCSVFKGLPGCLPEQATHKAYHSIGLLSTTKFNLLNWSSWYFVTATYTTIPTSA
ncbi:hypothetical protein, partial [Levilactobacillus paucivorans]|uniref:hypothetical protein n=1 Tax=Levilactobacillus paucivorans TaxID=616990 RepID=UPI001ED9BB19